MVWVEYQMSQSIPLSQGLIQSNAQTPFTFEKAEEDAEKKRKKKTFEMKINQCIRIKKESICVAMGFVIKFEFRYSDLQHRSSLPSGLLDLSDDICASM